MSITFVYCCEQELVLNKGCCSQQVRFYLINAVQSRVSPRLTLVPVQVDFLRRQVRLISKCGCILLFDVNLKIDLLLASLREAGYYSCQQGKKKFHIFFGCKTRCLRSRVLSGTIETTITLTPHGCHIIRKPIHPVTARKEVLIKFTFINVCRNLFEPPTKKLPH